MSTAAPWTPTAVFPQGVSLEYRLALDLACAHLYAARSPEEPLLLLASTPTCAYEGLLRAGASTALWPEDSGTAAAVAGLLVLSGAEGLVLSGAEGLVLSGAEGLAHGPLSGSAASVAQLPLAGTAPLPGVYPLVLWTTPLRETWRERLAAIHAAMTDGGVLAIVTPGLLGRLLTPLLGRHPFGSPPAAATLGRELVAAGYTSLQQIKLGSLSALLWAARARLALALGEPGQADRCEAGYRAALAPASRKGPSRCTLILARKGRCPEPVLSNVEGPAEGGAS
ncbi:MAG: hypothetical protein HYY02_12690 [Chloroflexi bacterium]|nr:hypothetical protein [Chloroflexota bacterium]